MKKLAVIVTRGGYNNPLQGCELITLAALNGVQVGVLFRDEAASIMSLKNCKEAGDIKFSVRRDSVGHFSISVEELIPELDEVQQTQAFWKEAVSEADQILTF